MQWVILNCKIALFHFHLTIYNRNLSLHSCMDLTVKYLGTLSFSDGTRWFGIAHHGLQVTSFISKSRNDRIKNEIIKNKVIKLLT